MPHLVIEVSPEVVIDDEKSLLITLNQALMDSMQFRASRDIKSRLYRPVLAQVGLAEDEQGFVFARLSLLSGRSDATKEELAKRLLTTLQGVLSPKNTNLQYAVEVVDLTTYIKTS